MDEKGGKDVQVKLMLMTAPVWMRTRSHDLGSASDCFSPENTESSTSSPSPSYSRARRHWAKADSASLSQPVLAG